MASLITRPIVAALCLISFVSGQQINTVEVGATRYLISDFSPYSPRLNWFLAYQYCHTIGMELLTMPRQEEALDLILFLHESGKSEADYWTSGNQLGSPMWTWMANGQQLNSSFNFWDARGPPLTKGLNNCISMQNGIWSASNCMDEKYFICQLTRCYYFNYVVTNRAATSTQGTTTDLGTRPSLSNVNNPNTAEAPPETITGRNHDQNHSRNSINNSDQLDSIRIQPNQPLIQSVLDHEAITTKENEPLSRFRPINLSNSPSVSPTRQENSLLDQNNEIDPSRTTLERLSQDLLPPTDKLTSAQHSPDSRPFITAAEVGRRMKRKEAFSWALTDDTKTDGI